MVLANRCSVAHENTPALRDITCGFIIAQPLAKPLNEAIARGEVKRREDFEDDKLMIST